MRGTIKAQIIKGQLDIFSREKLNNIIEIMGEGEVAIVVQTLSDIDNYRAEYFAIVDALRDVTGYTKAETHSIFKEQVLLKKLDKKSTKDLELEKWPTFLTEVRNYIFDNLDLVI